MNSNQKATALSALALSLIGVCFVLLLQDLVISKHAWEEVPRLFAGLASPVPLGIFLAFVFAHRGGGPRPEPAPAMMCLLLLASIGATIGGGFLVRFAAADNASTAVAPAIAESAIFSASVLNSLLFRSQVIAAALSGTSIGLTAFVIYLT